ncbi:ATP-binding cassette domain-containing protein [Candidatus Gracilibacteria bacterium]|nr:ATP-binding cassette domain-containing protein [Candidatus Gracilibacteria bacterium]
MHRIIFSNTRVDIIDTLQQEELETIINSVLEQHSDLNYYEVEEICQDFLDEIPKKIKNITKFKRLRKFVSSEFELDKKKSDGEENNYGDSKPKTNYCLETIPKYLFEGKSKIQSSLISIKNLTRNIGLTHLFDAAELQINKTDKVALIGKNGCGKTTLLKIIIGKESDQMEGEGQVLLAPGINIGYLSQDLFWISEENTLAEEMLQVFPEVTKQIQRLDEISAIGEDWEEIEKLNKQLAEEDGFRKYELQNNILKYFGFTEEQMSQNVLSLSGGEQTKVQIAKFLINEVDILILDEPTNHLDIEGIIFLEKFCQNWKKALVSISHDIRFIDNSSERIIEVSQKKITSYTGKYIDYLEQKDAKYNKDMKDFKDQQKELQTTSDYINRFRANSAKASSVQSRIKAMEKITVLEEPLNEQTVKFISLQSEKRLPEIIMKLENIQVGYTFPLITFPEEIAVHKSEKIGIIGANGTGKTTLLKTILGDLKALAGTANINETIKIGSFAQILEELDLSNSIINELGKSHNNEQEIRKILGGLLIQGDKVNQRIDSLSGGERAKVGLTKMLLQRPDIIVMDEPTNHLDLHSKQVIKKMLHGFNGTTLIVSHDRDLLENVSNKIWLIRNKELEIYDEVEEGIREVY